MKIKTSLLIITLSIFTHTSLSGQESSSDIKNDSILRSLIHRNISTFKLEDNSFHGEGWNLLLKEAKKCSDVLIGEDHFLNEIPLFTSQLISEIKFDNFFIEIDPISAQILSNVLRGNSDSEKAQFKKKFGNTLSFYALEPEFDLLQKMIDQNTRIFGTDQVIMTADRLMYHYLKKISKNKDAVKIYEDMAISSQKYYKDYSLGKGKPYLLSDDFGVKVTSLDNLDLLQEEIEILKEMKLSRQIYVNNDHHLRIQLMKKHLLSNFYTMKSSKNLYKYGAIHMGKNESLLGGYDLGNTVHNIADSRFQKSLHLLIIGAGGVQGSPIKEKPSRKIDHSKGPLRALMPFFEVAESKSGWYVFDIASIKNELTKKRIQISNRTLNVLMDGYDYLVVIPKVSPSGFVYDN